MCMKLFKLTILALMFSFSGALLAQESTDQETETEEPEVKVKALAKADAYYDAREYVLAIEQYKKAFSKAKDRKDKTEITFKIAESYRAITDCKNAAAQYKRAYKMKYGALAQLRYAEMLKCQGEYEDAIIEYQAYRQEVPDDPRGEKGIESCKKSLEMMQNPTRYLVTNIKEVNSKARDYAPAYAGKRAGDYSQLYISSSRPEATGKRESGITGEAYPDVFVATAERKRSRGRGRSKPSDNEPMKFSTPLPLSETINTDDGEGAITFDSRRKTMYFTRCENIKNHSLGCAIWVTKQMGQDWQTPEKVVLTNDSSRSVGHPSLSSDDKILYFAGDLEGSKGGKDIWMTTFDRRKKAWNTPRNLGPKVNTADDELYPFAHDDGYLYFSSDGHPGLGGMDIYRVAVNEEGMPSGEVENMGYPINTNAQDFGIIWESGDAAKGFMSSDRAKASDDDIYSVYLVPLKFSLDGIITSTKDGSPVQQATVTLKGTDGTSTSVTTDDNGYYKFDHPSMAENTTYKIVISRKKFLTNEYDATTIGVPVNAFEYIPSENIYLHGLKLNMKMDPIEIPIVLPKILFDLAKWDLRPESMVSLDTVAEILERNPNIVVELRSHTDYRDTDEKNQVLSQHRADTCVKYLISKGIEAERMVPVGMGESEPYTIPEGYKGYGAGEFDAGTTLSESYIKRLATNDKKEIAHQINRRTDMKVLRDDYVSGVKTEDGKKDADKEDGPPPGEFYTCGPRESFGKIAKKFKLTVVDLKKLNGGLRGARPFEGMVLKVTKGGDYTDFDNSHYQAKSGDNYSKIAKATGVDKKTLKNLNDGITDKDIMPGMYIRIK